MDVESRICALEGRVRSLRRATAILSGLLILGLVAAAGSDQEVGDLKGRSLTLTSPSGRVWLTARSLEGGGILRLHGEEPNGGIAIRVEQKQKLITVSKNRLFPHVILGLDEHETPGLIMTRLDGTHCLMMGEAHPEGSGFAVAFDKKEEPIAKLPANLKWPPE